MTKAIAERRRDVAKVFLETTIQIDRFLESPERRTEIRKNLVGKELCTSTYVWMEFRRTLLKDLFYVHSTVDSERSTTADRMLSLDRLLREMLQRRGEHTGRRIDRSCKIIAWIMETFQHTRIKKSKILEFLSAQLDELPEEFYEVEPMEEGEILEVHCSNLTNCTLVLTGKYYCRREEACCQLPSILAEHADVLDKVRQVFDPAAGASTAKHRQPKTAEAAKRVMKEPVDWHLAKGQENCWPLGDTIIALESPADAALYTTDHHYDVICPIVGRVLYDEPYANFRGRPLGTSEPKTG